MGSRVCDIKASAEAHSNAIGKAKNADSEHPAAHD